MSFTAAYTELESLAEGGPHRGVTITDRDGLMSVPEGLDIQESTYKSMLVTDEWTDHTAYPTETWDVLMGFKSWKPTDAFGLEHDPDVNALRKRIEGHEDYRKGPLGYGYNIERCGIPYGGVNGVWRDLFTRVSEHTEPFALYHSPVEHEFPDVTEIDADEPATVYYIECDDGDLYLEERTFELTATDVLVDECEDES